MGWSGKKNGELLSLAETEFEALLRMDQGFDHLKTFHGAEFLKLSLRASTKHLCLNCIP